MGMLPEGEHGGVKIPIAMREFFVLATFAVLCLGAAALPLPEGAIHRIGAGFPVGAAAAGKSVYVVTSIAIEHWDLASGELRGEIPLPWVPEIAAFPPGAGLVALAREGKLSVLGLPGGAEILSVERERGITALSFSPHDLLAVGYEGGLVEVLDGESGEVLLAEDFSDNDVTVLSFSHEGGFLAVAGKGEQVLYLLRVDSGDIVAKFPWNRWGIVSVAFSTDGRLIAIGANDSVVRVWDLDERRLLVNLASPVGPPRILAFAEGELLAVGAFGTVARWSVPDWSPGSPVELGIDTTRSSLSGRTIVSYPKRGPVAVADLSSGEILARLGEGRYPGKLTAAEFSPDGNLLALGTDAGTVRFLGSSWEEAFLAEGPAGAVDSLSFSPDGKYLVAASGGRVWIWEVLEGEAKLLRQFLAHTKPISEVDFSPEGDLFLTASWDETVRVWDLEGKPLLSLWKPVRVEALQPLIRDAAFAAAFSPKGDLIASGHEDKTVRLWELEGKKLHVLKKHRGVVWCVAFSPDGGLLASGGEEGMVVLWDVVRRRALGILRDDGVPVYSLAFSVDGELLFVGDAEGKFEVYSVEKRARVAELRGHLGPIYGIAVHPGGSLLVTASADGTALVWDLGELSG